MTVFYSTNPFVDGIVSDYYKKSNNINNKLCTRQSNEQNVYNTYYDRQLHNEQNVYNTYYDRQLHNEENVCNTYYDRLYKQENVYNYYENFSTYNQYYDSIYPKFLNGVLVYNNTLFRYNNQQYSNISMDPNYYLLP